MCARSARACASTSARSSTAETHQKSLSRRHLPLDAADDGRYHLRHQKKPPKTELQQDVERVQHDLKPGPAPEADNATGFFRACLCRGSLQVATPHIPAPPQGLICRLRHRWGSLWPQVSSYSCRARFRKPVAPPFWQPASHIAAFSRQAAHVPKLQGRRSSSASCSTLINPRPCRRALCD